MKRSMFLSALLLMPIVYTDAMENLSEELELQVATALLEQNSLVDVIKSLKALALTSKDWIRMVYGEPAFKPLFDLEKEKNIFKALEIIKSNLHLFNKFVDNGTAAVYLHTKFDYLPIDALQNGLLLQVRNPLLKIPDLESLIRSFALPPLKDERRRDQLILDLALRDATGDFNIPNTFYLLIKRANMKSNEHEKMFSLVSEIPLFQHVISQYLRWYQWDVDIQKVFGVLRLLLDDGNADVNAVYPDGRTPLMLVCRRHELIDMVKFLVEHGADINRKSNNSKTALMFAIENGAYEIVRFLLTKNPDLSQEELDSLQRDLYASQEDFVKSLQIAQNYFTSTHWGFISKRFIGKDEKGGFKLLGPKK